MYIYNIYDIYIYIYIIIFIIYIYIYIYAYTYNFLRLVLSFEIFIDMHLTEKFIDLDVLV